MRKSCAQSAYKLCVKSRLYTVVFLTVSRLRKTRLFVQVRGTACALKLPQQWFAISWVNQYLYPVSTGLITETTNLNYIGIKS